MGQAKSRPRFVPAQPFHPAWIAQVSLPVLYRPRATAGLPRTHTTLRMSSYLEPETGQVVEHPTGELHRCVLPRLVTA